jgi:uncharacterized protein (TIGR03000 family)
MKMRARYAAGCAALAGLLAAAGTAAAWPFGGGIGNAMIYGPYTGGHGYSYAEAYGYNLPFTSNGFSSPWTYPYDWTSIPNNGYVYPGRPLFKKTPPYFAVPEPVDLAPVPGGPAGEPACAVLSVHVPPNAEVWFDGNPTQLTGSDRTFQSPPLPAGPSYHYAVRARWTEDGKAVEQFQMVKVQAGQQSRVSFPQR